MARNLVSSKGEHDIIEIDKMFDYDKDAPWWEKGLKTVGDYTLGAGMRTGVTGMDFVRGDLMGDPMYQRDWSFEDDFGDAAGGVPLGGPGVVKGAQAMSRPILEGVKHLSRQGAPGALKRSMSKLGNKAVETGGKALRGALPKTSSVIGGTGLVAGAGLANGIGNTPLPQMFDGGETKPSDTLPGKKIDIVGEDQVPELPGKPWNPENPQQHMRPFSPQRQDFDPRQGMKQENLGQMRADITQTEPGSFEEKKAKAALMMGQAQQQRNEDEGDTMFANNANVGDTYNRMRNKDAHRWEDLDYDRRKQLIQSYHKNYAPRMNEGRDVEAGAMAPKFAQDATAQFRRDDNPMNPNAQKNQGLTTSQIQQRMIKEHGLPANTFDGNYAQKSIGSGMGMQGYRDHMQSNTGVDPLTGYDRGMDGNRNPITGKQTYQRGEYPGLDRSMIPKERTYADAFDKPDDLLTKRYRNQAAG